MRSYFKGFRSSDFKTLIVDVPEGTELEDFEIVAIEHTARLNIPIIHNFFTNVPNWFGYDESLTIPIVGPLSGTDLANFIYNIQPYDEHPLN
jgi:hypothetical protein